MSNNNKKYAAELMDFLDNEFDYKNPESMKKAREMILQSDLSYKDKENGTNFATIFLRHMIWDDVNDRLIGTNGLINKEIIDYFIYDKKTSENLDVLGALLLNKDIVNLDELLTKEDWKYLIDNSKDINIYMLLDYAKERVLKTDNLEEAYFFLELSKSGKIKSAMLDKEFGTTEFSEIELDKYSEIYNKIDYLKGLPKDSVLYNVRNLRDKTSNLLSNQNNRTLK